eukprot:6908889-Pyramimonas_sp.AAC.1
MGHRKAGGATATTWRSGRWAPTWRRTIAWRRAWSRGCAEQRGAWGFAFLANVYGQQWRRPRSTTTTAP